MPILGKKRTALLKPGMSNEGWCTACKLTRKQQPKKARGSKHMLGATVSIRFTGALPVACLVSHM